MSSFCTKLSEFWANYSSFVRNGHKPIKWYKFGFNNRSMRTVGLLGIPCSVMLINLKIRAVYELNIPNSSGLKGPHMCFGKTSQQYRDKIYMSLLCNRYEIINYLFWVLPEPIIPSKINNMNTVLEENQYSWHLLYRWSTDKNYLICAQL